MGADGRMDGRSVGRTDGRSERNTEMEMQCLPLLFLHATLAERRRHEVSREQEAREQYRWNSVNARVPGARTKTAPPDAPRFAYVYSVFEVFRPGAGSGNARIRDTRKPRMDNVTLRYGTYSGILE